MPSTRKYQFTRIGKGDYLLPSNDAKTIWRLMRYEDGPTHGIAEWSRDRDLWGVWKWIGLSNDEIDLDDWNSWEMRESSLDTRKEAVEAALRL